MAEIDHVLATQLGLVHRTQAIERGVSPRTIERRCSSGDWERVQPCVFRSCAFAVTHEQRLLAAALAAGSASAVSHRSAAVMWQSRRLTGTVIEVSVPTTTELVLNGALLHRVPDLVPQDVTSIGPIPVTTRPRTLVDLGSVVRPWLVSRTLEEWLRDGHVTVAEVRAVLERVARKGRSGVGVLRTILDGRALGVSSPDSLAEAKLAEALRAVGAPQPVHHHLVTVGFDTFEVDFAYPSERLLIEVDGFAPHTTPAAFEEDRRRQNLLEEAGHMVLRYTAARVMRRAHAIAADIERNRRKRLPGTEGQNPSDVAGYVAENGGGGWSARR